MTVYFSLVSLGLFARYLAGLHKIHRLDFSVTWWEDGERAKEEPIQRSRNFDFRGLTTILL